MKISILNVNNEVVGETELAEATYCVTPNESVMHQVVCMQLAKRRRGTASTKTRSEVSGSGRKPWRQKGTGRARIGSNTSPVWVRGGSAFGPKPRDYSFTMPKKMKRLALRSALSLKLSQSELLIVDQISIPQPKTRYMCRLLANLKAGGRVLLVTAEMDWGIIKSIRNIPGAKVLPVAGLNVYDLLLADKVIVVLPALAGIEKRLAGAEKTLEGESNGQVSDN